MGRTLRVLEPTEFSPHRGENSKRPAIRKSRLFKKATAGRVGSARLRARRVPSFSRSNAVNAFRNTPFFALNLLKNAILCVIMMKKRREEPYAGIL